MSKISVVKYPYILIRFYGQNLIKFIPHRKHYRSTIKDFHMFDSVEIDVIENLTLPVKYQAQSLHWSYTQITVHSSIVKVDGEKSYHPYFSDKRNHDLVFVKILIDKMISNIDLTQKVAESDNCKGQYKSAKHIYDLQQLAKTTNTKVIRAYSIAGHSKGDKLIMWEG